MTEKETKEFVDYFWETVPPHIYFKNMLNENYSCSNIRQVKPIVLSCDLNRQFYIETQ